MATQLVGNRAGRHSLSGQFLDPQIINSSPAPLVNAIGFRLCDPRALPLPANVVLEFRHRAQDGEGQLARAAAGVDRLVDALECNAFAAKFVQ